MIKELTYKGYPFLKEFDVKITATSEEDAFRIIEFVQQLKNE